MHEPSVAHHTASYCESWICFTPQYVRTSVYHTLTLLNIYLGRVSYEYICKGFNSKKIKFFKQNKDNYKIWKTPKSNLWLTPLKY